MDSRICQTSDASPAEPGGLPLTLDFASWKSGLSHSRRSYGHGSCNQPLVQSDALGRIEATGIFCGLVILRRHNCNEMGRGKGAGL